MTYGLAKLSAIQPTEAASIALRRRSRRESHLISVNALSCYVELVQKCGGDAEQLLKAVGISVDFARGTDFIQYQKFVDLLHHSALALDRPDFGLALSLEQRGIALLGPLEVAMRNSPTLGEAVSYYMEHSDIISSAVSLSLERDPFDDRPYFTPEIYSRYPFHLQQTTEHAIAALHHGLSAFSEGKVKTREVWFPHAAISSPHLYRRYFGARVQFDMPYAALFVDESDLAIALPNSAPKLFEMADAVVAWQCNSNRTFSSKVRAVLAKCLPSDATMKEAVASKLNLHPKTLQRRLQEEGVSFAELRDQVRRDAALRYLTETQIPITRVAALLGYSETAVLSRRCREWFGRSPSKLRNEAKRQPEETPLDTSGWHGSRNPASTDTRRQGGQSQQVAPSPCEHCGSSDRTLEYEARIDALLLEIKRLQQLLGGVPAGSFPN